MTKTRRPHSVAYVEAWRITDGKVHRRYLNQKELDEAQRVGFMGDVKVYDLSGKLLWIR